MVPGGVLVALVILIALVAFVVLMALVDMDSQMAPCGLKMVWVKKVECAKAIFDLVASDTLNPLICVYIVYFWNLYVSILDSI